jgi:CRP/FNR family cyclic AMP-dependent transcriptional regulator
MARDEKLEKLRRVPLFAELGKSDIERLGMIADEIDLPDGRILTREGASGSEFFIITSGDVEIERGGRLLSTLGPGEFLGEIALIDGAPRTATARAKGPIRVMVVGRAGFHNLMEEFPSIRTSVLQALAKRIRQNEPSPVA